MKLFNYLCHYTSERQTDDDDFKNSRVCPASTQISSGITGSVMALESDWIEI